MPEGIQMWAGRLSKVGEPAIGVTVTLVGYHVGPYPVEKHWPFGGSTLLSLTHGPVENRTITGRLSAP